MEIEKEKVKINPKAIFDYCFRVFVFLVLNSKYVIAKVADFYTRATVKIGITNFLGFEECILLLFLFWLFYVALTIKLCGIFKKIEKLYLPFSLLLIMLISVLFSYACPVIKHGFFIDVFKDVFFYILLVYFFVYIFLRQKH